MTTWRESDEFWTTTAPMMFGEERWRAAPAEVAQVLTDLFGEVSFTDHTHEGQGLAARSFASFDAFAEEAAISRLYGGIHYRSAIEAGLAQGRCIGRQVIALEMSAPPAGQS
jgi:hypothetical protein